MNCYENLPIFGVNVKIWRLCGFIRSRSHRRALLFAVVPILTNVCQILNIYMKMSDFTSLTLSLFMVAIIFNSIARIFIVVRNEKKFVRFMRNVANWYRDVECSESQTTRKIFKNITARTQFISKFSLGFGTLGGILTALFPLIMQIRELPYDVYVPGLDIYKSPLYELIYLTQTVVVMPFIVSTYIPFTNLFLSWLMFGIGVLQDLRHKLESIHDMDERFKLQELKKCIKYHSRIIRFRQNLEELVSTVTLMEFMLFTIMLCVLLFFILIIDSLLLQFIAAIYIACIFYVIFLSYWHANEFSYESLNIAEAAYGVEWINGSDELRQCVLIMIARSQNALQISAGGFYPMTLESFQALLNAAYSYFTLLKGLTAK